MSIRIMSSNIWGDYFKNPVEVREDQLGAVFERYTPDILAMQEATKSWNASKLFEFLRDVYAYVESDEAPENNFVPLLYRRDMFDCVETGFVKFPDTPDKSKGATWAVLSHKESGKKLAVFCTHFWWQKFGEAEHDAIRVSNAKLLTAKALELIEKYGMPVVAMGDMNSWESMPTLPYLRENGWKCARDYAPDTSEVGTHHGDPVLGEDGRYHGKRTERNYTWSIDHIIYRGDIKPKKFVVIEDQDALDATDHSPIFCDFEL
ncbi:MAG: endonuclease/exonuclease/phosphatase family protein [Clostridia bacterium]|nr:endonuclease/exonuclease/phosphatase family protein [Clostridia bacterium]